MNEGTAWFCARTGDRVRSCMKRDLMGVRFARDRYTGCWMGQTFESAQKGLTSERIEPEAAQNSLRDTAARKIRSSGARMCSQRSDRLSFEPLRSVLGDEPTVRHIALYRGAARIRHESTRGASRSPALAVRPCAALALNCHLTGKSPARGGARNRAASSAQAELSVRKAAVRVQYVDAWPQRRRARGSARRQHTIVVVHIREVPGEVRFWMPAPACEGRAGRCKERRRTPRVLGNACESLLDLRTTQNVATLQRLPEAGPPT
jgi:hypothetical protein